MTGERQLLRIGEYLVGLACRRLPQEAREERYREWAAELPAILDDPQVGFAPRRAVRMLAYAGGTLRLSSVVGKVAWIVAAAASVALCTLLLLLDFACFIIGWAAGGPTGDTASAQASSWQILGAAAGNLALTVVIIILPGRFRRLRASARSSGQDLRPWLAQQQRWPLARILMSFNAPAMVFVAVGVALTVMSVYQSASTWVPLWAAASGLVIAIAATLAEIAGVRYVLRRRQRRA